MAIESWGSMLDEIRRQEAELKISPNVEGYLAIADRYSEMGLTKEAARAYRMAEQCESAAEATVMSDPEPLLSGALTRGMVVEIIQMIMNTQRTGELIVISARGDETLRLYVEQGRVINATGSKTPRGQRSFERALALGNGTYKFFEKSVEHIEVLFDQNTEHLLLDTLQKLDEATHARQQFDGTP